MARKNVANWTLADYERAAEEYSANLRDAQDVGEQLKEARNEAAREKKRADAAEKEVKRLRALLEKKAKKPTKRNENGK